MVREMRIMRLAFKLTIQKAVIILNSAFRTIL